jgi:hypothetical protein
MALDRTWYNSLVDDDGSGMTGSVWDKADVDSLMDAVDAEIARLDSLVGRRTVWSPIPHSDTGVPLPVTDRVCSYHVVNDAVYYAFYLSMEMTTAGSPTILLPLPGGLIPVQAVYEESMFRLAIASAEIGYVRPRDAAWIECRRYSNAAFPTGPFVIIGQGFYYWR